MKTKSMCINIVKLDHTYARVNYDKDGEEEYTYISNFIINPKFCIKADNHTEYHVILKNKEYEVEHIFMTSDLSSKKNFKESICKKHAYFSFTGNDNDIEIIKVVMSKENEIEKIGINHTGFFMDKDDKWCYIDKNKCIGNKESVLISSVTNNIDYDIKNILNKEEALKLSRLIFAWNIPKVTYTLINTVTSFFLKARLKNLKIKTSNIGIYGEAGSGKSETTENIIQIFFKGANAEASDSLKKFGATKILSESNLSPLIIEEYKDYKLNKFQLDLISSLIRSGYDGQVTTRGHADQTVTTYAYIAPIIVIGETPASETAWKDRMMEIIFSKSYHNSENFKNFEEIKKDNTLIEKLSNMIVLESLKISDEEILSYKQKSEKLLEQLSSGFNSRIVNGLNCQLISYQILIKLFKNFGIEIENIANVAKIIIEAQFDFNLNGEKNTKSISEITLENVKTMIDMDIIKKNYDYVIKDNKICLRLSQVYAKLLKYRKEYDIKEEICNTKNAFITQIERTNYFISKNTSTKEYWDCQDIKTNQKCLILDLEKLNNIFGSEEEEETELPLPQNVIEMPEKKELKTIKCRIHKFDRNLNMIVNNIINLDLSSSHNQILGNIYTYVDNYNIFIPEFEYEKTKNVAINNLNVWGKQLIQGFSILKQVEGFKEA